MLLRYEGYEGNEFSSRYERCYLGGGYLGCYLGGRYEGYDLSSRYERGYLGGRYEGCDLGDRHRRCYLGGRYEISLIHTFLDVTQSYIVDNKALTLNLACAVPHFIKCSYFTIVQKSGKFFNHTGSFFRPTLVRVRNIE